MPTQRQLGLFGVTEAVVTAGQAAAARDAGKRSRKTKKRIAAAPVPMAAPPPLAPIPSPPPRPQSPPAHVLASLPAVQQACKRAAGA